MIPIMFNQDDTNNEKKGNVRAQDLASILAFSLPKNAGVLDIFSNPCSIYQTSYTTGFATVTLHKGYVSIFGRLIYVEEGEQVQVQLPTDSSTVTGVFGIRINLAENGANEVTWFTKTTTLQQDDLLNNEQSGVYEFGLYTYTATSANLTLNAMIAPKIDRMGNFIKGENYETKALTNNSTAIATTAFVQSLFAQAKTISKNQETGYLKLDSGIIIKWGFHRTPSGTNWQVVPFDTTVPFSQIFIVLVAPKNDSQDDAWIQIKTYDATQFKYRCSTDRTDCMYLAIGV